MPEPTQPWRPRIVVTPEDAMIDVPRRIELRGNHSDQDRAAMRRGTRRGSYATKKDRSLGPHAGFLFLSAAQAHL
jgi:hypothetical protein